MIAGQESTVASFCGYFQLILNKSYIAHAINIRVEGSNPETRGVRALSRRNGQKASIETQKALSGYQQPCKRNEVKTPQKELH